VRTPVSAKFPDLKLWANGHNAIIAAMQVACDRASRAALGSFEDNVGIILRTVRLLFRKSRISWYQ
jgi:hypothetical protein